MFSQDMFLALQLPDRPRQAYWTSSTMNLVSEEAFFEVSSRVGLP
jgi:hypothetical protein